jgi:uncharacterized membrane-anchored protein YitT (DUF2179 family)
MEREGERHRLYEDALALLTGTLFVALGAMMYSEALLLTGGVAGLALLLQHATGLGFWLLFFAVNLPFYLFAWRRMGRAFTLRTFVAVSLVSILSRLTPSLVDFAHLDPGYAAVAGGGLCGTGMLILFRHRTGLGGINIVALMLQESWGIRAGYLQLGFDLAILAAATFVLSPEHVLLSVLGATIVNLVVAINHRPGRYLGVT